MRPLTVSEPVAGNRLKGFFGLEAGGFDVKPARPYISRASRKGILPLMIGPGAAEHVISERLAPRYPRRRSAGSKGGIGQTAANGTTMPHRGEEVVSRTRPLRPQEHDEDGSCGRPEAMRQRAAEVRCETTSFILESNACRMGKDAVHPPAPGFTQQGK